MEGKHLRNSCGSESGKGERKHTEKPSTGLGKECTGNQAGENGEERKKGNRKTSTEEATVRRNRDEGDRKKQRLSSQNPKLKRPKGSENSGGQKEKRKRQQAVKVEAQRSRKTRASREKHLQRLMPAEDERKLQTKPA